MSTRSQLWLLLAPPALLSTTGCANPGPPRPPSLQLPAPVRDLRAERIGDGVRLTWTTPTETTDDLPVRPPLRVEICRDLAPVSPSTTCTVVQRLPAAAGAAVTSDPLPPELLRDPARVLVYHVRVLNAAGHAADPSAPALAAAGGAPPPVALLHAEPAQAGGLDLLWQPISSPAAVLLRRSTDMPAPARRSGPLRSDARGSDAVLQLQGSAPGADRGGAMDAGVVSGTTYTYVAWRLRTVAVGAQTLTLRSADSAPVRITFRDLIPPAAPAGVDVAADGPAVDLSWEPATEPDFAGYRVERAPASDPGQWTRLNAVLLAAPAFRDQPPPGAAAYLYRIFAVDAAGNVSPASSPVSIRLQPTTAP